MELLISVYPPPAHSAATLKKGMIFYFPFIKFTFNFYKKHTISFLQRKIRFAFFVITFTFVLLLFSSLLMMIVKNSGDHLLEAGTAWGGLPFRQNSSDTFCRGLVKRQKTSDNIYCNMNIYGCTVPQTHSSHILYIP